MGLSFLQVYYTMAEHFSEVGQQDFVGPLRSETQDDASGSPASADDIRAFLEAVDLAISGSPSFTAWVAESGISVDMQMPRENFPADARGLLEALDNGGGQALSIEQLMAAILGLRQVRREFEFDQMLQAKLLSSPHGVTQPLRGSIAPSPAPETPARTTGLDGSGIDTGGSATVAGVTAAAQRTNLAPSSTDLLLISLASPFSGMLAGSTVPNPTFTRELYGVGAADQPHADVEELLRCFETQQVTNAATYQGLLTQQQAFFTSKMQEQKQEFEAEFARYRSECGAASSQGHSSPWAGATISEHPRRGGEGGLGNEAIDLSGVGRALIDSGVSSLAESQRSRFDDSTKAGIFSVRCSWKSTAQRRSYASVTRNCFVLHLRI